MHDCRTYRCLYEDAISPYPWTLELALLCCVRIYSVYNMLGQRRRLELYIVSVNIRTIYMTNSYPMMLTFPDRMIFSKLEESTKKKHLCVQQDCCGEPARIARRKWWLQLTWYVVGSSRAELGIVLATSAGIPWYTLVTCEGRGGMRDDGTKSGGTWTRGTGTWGKASPKPVTHILPYSRRVR